MLLLAFIQQLPAAATRILSQKGRARLPADGKTGRPVRNPGNLRCAAQDEPAIIRLKGRKKAVNKRSFATRKVYARKPASTKTGKKSAFDTGAIKKGSKTILIWGLLVINVILVASLVKKIIIPSGGTDTSIVDSSSTSVSVLNGCGVKGVALVFADALREKHYNVVNTGNAETFDYEKSVLINRGQISSKEAEKIAALVGVSRDRILTIESKTSQSDVDLIIGSDYKDLRAYKKKH